MWTWKAFKEHSLGAFFYTLMGLEVLVFGAIVFVLGAALLSLPVLIVVVAFEGLWNLFS